jgi:hypothetical protein
MTLSCLTAPNSFKIHLLFAIKLYKYVPGQPCTDKPYSVERDKVVGMKTDECKRYRNTEAELHWDSGSKCEQARKRDRDRDSEAEEW